MALIAARCALHLKLNQTTRCDLLFVCSRCLFARGAQIRNSFFVRFKGVGAKIYSPLAAIMVRKFCENLIEPYRSPRDCASLRKGYGC